MTRFLFDGAKSANLDSLPAEAWTIISGRQPGSDDVVDLVRTVPILQRAVTLVSDAVGSMPFAIMRGDTEIDTSAEYKNALGILPNLPAMLSLIETSILMWGAGYWFIGRNRGRRAKEIRYLAPSTIRPIIEPGEGLKGFTRVIGSNQIELAIDEVVYFWLPDPSIEVGPPSWSPVKSAIRAAGVLGSMDRFTTNFFDRGAIKATLLTVPATTRKADRETLRAWWRTVFGGVKNAFATEVINADDVKPVVIGEGIESLSNAELTREKREDIAVALGVPYSLLFPDAANFATAQQDDRHFYQKTIIPACATIANVINQQLLESFGCVLEFRPEGLDAMQEDEGNRASAFAAYVGAGIKQSIAAQLLGIELPAGIEYEDLDPEPQPQMQAQPGAQAEPGQGQADEQQAQKPAVKYDPDQPRDEGGRWTDGGGSTSEVDLHTLVDYEGGQRTLWYQKKLQWLDSLTEKERNSIRDWQRSGRDLRRQQSGEETPEQNPAAAETVKHLEAALDKGFRYEGDVYRGLNSVPRDTVATWEPGAIIELRNDQSSSTNFQYVEDKFQGRPWGGTENVIWKIPGQRSGVTLFDLSVDYGGIGRNEKEVVLRKGTRYRITSKTRNSTYNGYIIGLEEL